MGILSAIGAAISAVSEFFGWRKQVEINKPAEEKHEEVQQARKERDDNAKKIDDFMSGGKP